MSYQQCPKTDDVRLQTPRSKQLDEWELRAADCTADIMCTTWFFERGTNDAWPAS